ncbi:hypothetical protein B7494_g235 [Chlorociboria aeruginascens]|nr:hypothetical protein B7494_g235 [Chlorociboria aeruginascens]
MPNLPVDWVESKLWIGGGNVLWNGGVTRCGDYTTADFQRAHTVHMKGITFLDLEFAEVVRPWLFEDLKNESLSASAARLIMATGYDEMPSLLVFDSQIELIVRGV